MATGQERFAAMAPLYYRNAAAVIVCCDVTDEDSFTRMKDWVQEVTSNVPSGIVIAIACNKVSKRATTCLQQQPRALSLLEISAM
jgi:GTPase SAR1 family protein